MINIDKNKVDKTIKGLLFDRSELVSYNLNIYELREIHKYFKIYSSAYNMAVDKFVKSNFKNETVNIELITQFFNDIKKDINIILRDAIK